jgi:hypothetical protein
VTIVTGRGVNNGLTWFLVIDLTRLLVDSRLARLVDNPLFMNYGRGG